MASRINAVGIPRTHAAFSEQLATNAAPGDAYNGFFLCELRAICNGRRNDRGQRSIGTRSDVARSAQFDCGRRNMHNTRDFFRFLASAAPLLCVRSTLRRVTAAMVRDGRQHSLHIAMGCTHVGCEAIQTNASREFLRANATLTRRPR